MSVAHSVFRGSGGKGLSVLANEEADSLLEEVEAVWKEGGGGEVIIIYTFALFRFLCIVFSGA